MRSLKSRKIFSPQTTRSCAFKTLNYLKSTLALEGRHGNSQQRILESWVALKYLQFVTVYKSHLPLEAL